jgi:hypothetical protein
MCGSVRYVAEVEPINQRICHCRLCQRAIGAAFNARLLFQAQDVQVSGEVVTANSSPDMVRGFCPSCGTSIFTHRASNGRMSLTAGSLDDPAQFKPDMHFWVSSKQPWLVLQDDLPQFDGPAP